MSTKRPADSGSRTQVNQPYEKRSGQVTLAEYLLDRLYDAGVEDMFCVPGDFLLGLLNFVEKSKIKYIGTCNELNAAYAADCYARVKGIGALATTYNVGELSAINGVAGSFAENVPVVKITGSPATSHFKRRTLLHHTLGDYRVSLDMFKAVTCDAVILDNIETAPELIDRVLTNCLRYKLPVYISVPSDMVKMKVPAPKTPFRPQPLQVSDPEALREAMGEIIRLLEDSEKPILIPGVEITRYNLRSQFQQVLEASGYPYSTMLLAKTCLDEDHPQFIGLYCGDRSREYVRKRVEEADCIVIFGEKLTDFNTGGFTALLDDHRTINVAHDHVRISYHKYPNVYLHDVLAELAKHIPSKDPATLDIQCASHGCVHRRNMDFVPEASRELTMARFFDRMTKFMKEGSIVIAETGSALFAAAETQMPRGSQFIGQTFYGSIGYTVGATLGACMGAPHKRVYLFIGDGSFQVTCQDMSTMIRYGCKPVVFLINNDGYTIERVIVDHDYNDIQPWKYHKLTEAFGGGQSFDCYTEGELEDALAKVEELNELAFVEVHFDRFDCNDALKKAGAAMARNNDLLE